MTTTTRDAAQTARSVEWGLVIGGLSTGVLLGQAGNFVAAPTPQALFYGLSSLGLVVASALLTVHHLRKGATLVGVGFAMLAVAEMLIFVGGVEGAGYGSAFAAATLYYVPALAMISVPPALNLFARIAGGLSAIAFGGHAASFLLGNQPAPDEAFAVAGYVLLSLAVIGWIVDVVRWRRPHPA